jgi:hypothetical protein
VTVAKEVIMVRTRRSPLMHAGVRGLRYLGAGLILVNGGVHLYLWDHGYRQIRVIGPLFLLNAVAALLIAIALLWRPEGFTALLGLALSVGTFTSFMLAVTIGLFNFTAGWDPKAVLAALAEIGAIVVLGSWWVVTRRKRGAPAMGERDEGVILSTED